MKRIEHSMTRESALRHARSGEFGGLSMYDLERVVTLTGSRLAERERRRRIAAMGTFAKDGHGNIFR